MPLRLTRAVPLALALALAGASREAAAQQPTAGVLAGRVVERGDARPVEAAEVRLEGLGLAARTDSTGAWRFPALPAGDYTLRVRRIGFAPRTLRVALGARDTTLSVALQPTAIALDEVVVTASRREQRLADVVVPTEIVSRATIEATGAADLAAVLTEQTGIQFQEGHPSGAGVMLQGLSSERVLVLVDGQPLVGRISGNFDLSRIPTSVVERVEVVKGPQSALYGSEAMGGVVNIVTRKPEAGRWMGSARLVTGADGRLEAGLSGDASFGALGVALDVGRRAVERAPGREPLPGEAPAVGALAERTDVGARLAWAAAPSLDVDGAVLLLDERQRWPSGASLNEFADNLQVSGQLGATWSLGRHRLRPALSFSSFDHLARSSRFDQPIAGTGARQTQRLAEAEVLYAGPVLGTMVDAGLELKHERITADDGRIEGGVRTLVTAEPFVQVDLSRERWSLVPGARLSWNERWGTTLTPRLAMRYRVEDGLSLRAAVGRGFRAPDFKELYLAFVNSGANYVVRGNEALRPEHSTNLTAGVEWTGARLFARAQGFWNDLHDFIETRVVGSGTPTVYQYANVSEARTWGTELEAGLVLAPVRLEAGYAWLGTRDDATGQPLLGRPTHSGRLSLGLTPRAGTSASVTGIYTGRTPIQRDTTSGAVTASRDAFVRIDARVAQRLPAGLELVVGADNLFDARPALWSDEVGRQWYVGLSWTASTLSRD